MAGAITNPRKDLRGTGDGSAGRGQSGSFTRGRYEEGGFASIPGAEEPVVIAAAATCGVVVVVVRAATVVVAVVVVIA